MAHRSIRGVVSAVAFLSLLSPASETEARGERVFLKTGAHSPAFGAAESGSAASYVLVRFRDSLSLEQREALAEAGVELLDYIPFRAYIARVNLERRGSVAALPFVMGLEAFRPEWKISPSLGARRPGKSVVAVVSFFRGENTGAAVFSFHETGVRVLDVGEDAFRPRLRVEAPTANALRALASLDAVQWMEEEGEASLRNDSAAWVIQTNVVGYEKMWDAGLLGENQMFGMLDGAPDIESCFFLDGADNTPGPTHRKFTAWRGDAAATAHGTHVAGSLAGDRFPVDGLTDYNGHAPLARISFTNILSLTSSNLIDHLRAARDDGARVHSNSWGDDGTDAYTQWCADADAFSYENESSVVVFAVSNGAAVKSPENARNVLAVAASGRDPNQENHCAGGTGPTADGRRKPEIFAPGCNTNSALAGTACGVAAMTGTSMATAAVSGGLALARQYFAEGWHPSGAKDAEDAFEPSGALLRATALNASRDMAGIAGYPGDSEGWGRILLDDALYFAGDSRRTAVKDVRNAKGFSTGQAVSYTFSVEAGGHFRATLAFTDYPASLNASYVPVNDLDLEVQSPAATFKGNVFAGGQSAEGGTFDAANNVEQVHLASAGAGIYVVHVLAREVNQGNQGYALVVSGEGLAEIAAPALRYESHAVVDTPQGNGDGIVDPGETVILQLTLKNTGSANATGVSAALSTATPGITVQTASAAFPDISAGASKSSLSPHFSFHVDSSVPCGTLVEFSLAMTAAEGVWSDSFTLRVGAPQTTAETALQATALSVGKNSFAQSDLAPSLTIPAPATKAVLASPAMSGYADADVTAYVQMRLVAPGGAALTLKACGAPLAPSYDVTDFYNAQGAGLYKICVSTGASTGCGGAGCASQFGFVASLNVSGAALDVERTDYVCTPCNGACAASLGEVENFLWSDEESFSWTPTESADIYDLYRGDLALLPDYGECLQSNTVLTAFTDSAQPPVGEAWFYLVAAENAAGTGSLGADSEGNLRQPGAACP